MESDRLELKLSRQEAAEILIQPEIRWFNLGLGDLWRYRELLYFLAWRDIKVRYKQTALGITWAVLQPLLTMLIFSLIFGRIAALPSAGVPYPLFVLTALVPWQLFAYALSQSSASLVADQNLITKVYFPRLVIPISSVCAGLVDFAISLAMLAVLLIVYGMPLTWRLIVLPLCILLALLTAIAVGLWLSALNVRYRDVRYALPFITMVWMLITPVAYSSELIPENLRWLYSLNPMVGVVEGFRWALLDVQAQVGSMVVISAAVMVCLLLGGIAYFKRMEDLFADLI
jgi:lipopolysaccharide transport system permease protein